MTYIVQVFLCGIWKTTGVSPHPLDADRAFQATLAQTMEYQRGYICRVVAL